VTYPSLIEGFGNAFLEAVYFKKPLLVNRYPVFIKDIEPLGFDLAVMDGFLSAETVQHVRTLLDNPQRREEMVEHNYALAAQEFSYDVLRKSLEVLMSSLLHESVAPLLGDPDRDAAESLLTPALARPVSQAL